MVGGVACAAIIVAHFVPGINIALTTAELIATFFVGGGLLTGGIYGTLHKSARDRAVAYCQESEANLGKIQGELSLLKSSTIALRENGVVQQVSGMILKLEDKCNHIVLLASQ